MHKSPIALGMVCEGLAGVFGFAPVESLVVVAVVGGVLNQVMRVDLCGASSMLERLADLVVRADADADGAVAVVVSAEGALCPICGEQSRALVRGLSAALEERGMPLLSAAFVDRIEAGGRWSCIDSCGVAGILSDPASSVMAVAAVAQGRRMYGTREELQATVTVDVARAAALAPLLVGVGGEVGSVDGAVGLVVAAAQRMAQGSVLSDAELAQVAAPLVDKRVRDALLRTAASEDAVAAEALWSVLARVLPQPFRVEALSILAAAAYIRGDGPLAGVALEAALDLDSSHLLAGMLDTAVQNGIRPEQIAQVLIGAPPAARR